MPLGGRRGQSSGSRIAVENAIVPVEDNDWIVDALDDTLPTDRNDIEEVDDEDAHSMMPHQPSMPAAARSRAGCTGAVDCQANPTIPTERREDRQGLFAMDPT